MASKWPIIATLPRTTSQPGTSLVLLGGDVGIKDSHEEARKIGSPESREVRPRIQATWAK
jgi:hypothetical protein